ncbi:aminohydrolase ssna-related [Anaeramoeba ignava]|uniref:Aminohydrolase ssna-related n=1 Tax=Anaeramoeba ignava TaxID=1746090 RepID=A0A9Q0R5K8_ANAIG|nr:aminohydrolase ssna-related [Anaeramoeba ignava]
MTLLLNALLFTGKELKPQHGLYIENGIIKEIDETKKLEEKYKTESTEVIDAENKLVLPGLICGHGHFYGMYSRGMGLKTDEPPKNFVEVLEKLWWRLDKALDSDSTESSAMVCIIQAIKAGTTTIIDHHASPNFINGSLDVIQKAVKKSGIRSCLCYEVTDRNGEKGADEGIAENIRFIKKTYMEDPDPYTAAAFGLHAAFTLSDATLKKCKSEMEKLPKEVLEKTGFHIHIAEDGTDAKESLALCGKRTVQRLDSFGILNKNTLAGHCVFVDSDEIKLLSERGVNILHNPESNMNNGVGGVSDVMGFLSHNLLVGLGTDGITYDMFQEAKSTYFIHKHHHSDPRVMGAEVMQLLFQNNSAIASKFFSAPVGVLQVGAFADFVISDYDPPTPINSGNFPWHFVFGMAGADISTSVVHGKVIMKNRKILTFDEADVMKKARDLCSGVWERF